MSQPIRLYWKVTCSKCRRAVDLFHELDAQFEDREYSAKPLTEAEIREIAGSRSPLELMNPERPAYRELGFDEHTPTEDEAVRAMAQENNLIYRPIAIRGDRIVLGFKEEELRELIADDKQEPAAG